MKFQQKFEKKTIAYYHINSLNLFYTKPTSESSYLKKLLQKYILLTV